jgi:predicted transcriptional regulator of viral defense system
MDIKAVMTRYLRELDQPVITDYDFCVAVFNFHQKKKYRNEQIDISGQFPLYDEVINQIIRPLINMGIIAQHKDFPEGRVFQISGNQYLEAGDITCSVDPFAYVSHLSAMAYHGLTNRLPKILFISTPPSKDWQKFASQKMEKDCKAYLKDYLNCDFPKLINIKFEKVQKTQITRYSSIHQGAFKNVEGRNLRVTTIGRTFLDMLRKPDYCGSIRHVMDTFIAFGLQYKRLIIDEIDRHGNSIEQARAGYLLEDCCKIRDKKIDEWAKRVQRGGSRKLDPEGPYREIYSDRWCLSLNLD